MGSQCPIPFGLKLATVAPVSSKGHTRCASCFSELNAPLSDVDILAERCVIAGLSDAIDVSSVDASMVEDILGPEAARLGGVLLEGVEQKCGPGIKLL